MALLVNSKVKGYTPFQVCKRSRMHACQHACLQACTLTRPHGLSHACTTGARQASIEAQ